MSYPCTAGIPLHDSLLQHLGEQEEERQSYVGGRVEASTRVYPCSVRIFTTNFKECGAPPEEQAACSPASFIVAGAMQNMLSSALLVVRRVLGYQIVNFGRNLEKTQTIAT